MRLGDFFMPEFLHEMATTRKILDAIPEEHFDYKSNEKAMSLGALANHIAEIPTWIPAAFLHSELDFSTSNYVPKDFKKVSELLSFFDSNVTEATQLLKEVSNETLNEEWTLRNGSIIYFTMPKSAVYRSFVMNHLIHHRGQLSAYLRAIGAKVPGMYGPSADEQTA